jgi:CheY-like chemotaxis protein
VYLNQSGQAVRMAGLVTDITAEKVAVHEIQNAKLAAEDANREKSYFLANMSHEIRTPLGAILGFTEALRDPNLSVRERERYLQILTRNGRALAELIDDILDLSKVEAGFLEIENSKISVTELVSDVVSLLQVKAEAKSLKLFASVDPSVPAYVMSDPIRLRQIILNIVGNAIKFTNGGEVRVEVQPLQEADAGRDLLAIYVKDTGAGISHKAAQRLFNPFTQADSSTTRKFGGTGLGLALSRRLARALGGDVVLEKSAVGVGSEFRITIPAVIPLTEDMQIATSNQAAATSSLAHHSLKGLRVLLAEDSLDNQELIKRLLDKQGVATELADDGVQAVEKALHDDYDLVLMDMQMPHLDGYSATRELRRAGFCGPIVALTANAMRNDREKCLAAGCSDYLSKPIDANKLYQIMGHAMEDTH